MLVYVWVSMNSMYNQTWPNQPLESQPLHTCSDQLTHTTAKSILWAWDLLCPVLPSNHDSLQNSVHLLCHADLSAPVYLSPKVSFSDLLSLIPPFLCRHRPQHLCDLSCIKCIITHTYSSHFPTICNFYFASFSLVWSLSESSGRSFFYWGNQGYCITVQDRWTGHVLLVSDTVIK